MTMASVSRLMRAAVRWRVPVSVVGSVGSGFRWKLARRILVMSLLMTTAPSILQSSNRRLAVKDTSSLKPSVPAAMTASSSPMVMSAPRWPAMIISRAVRRAVPGAHMRRACSRRCLGLIASCLASWSSMVSSSEPIDLHYQYSQAGRSPIRGYSPSGESPDGDGPGWDGAIPPRRATLPGGAKKARRCCGPQAGAPCPCSCAGAASGSRPSSWRT